MVPPGVDMRNSREYSKKIQSLYNALSHKYGKVQRISHEEIVDAIIHGIVSAALAEKEAEAAIKRFAEYFVDWNDLRVSRTEEIVEALGGDTQATRAVAFCVLPGKKLED